MYINKTSVLVTIQICNILLDLDKDTTSHPIHITLLVIKRSRIVLKNGELRTKIDSKEEDSLFSCKYIKDIFISTLNLDWFSIFVIFSAAFFGSWLFFAVVWYLIVIVHEDHGDSNGYGKCVDNVQDFTTSFLFSGKCEF